MFGLALACVAYGLSSERDAILVLDAVLLGLSISAVSTVAPVFVLSARLAPTLEANRLTTLNLTQPVGQMLLGALLAAAAAAGWSFPDRFYLAAAFLGVFAVLVWFTSAAPARAIHVENPTVEPSEASDEKPPSQKPKTLTAEFGLILAITFLTSVAFQAIVGQISNILPKVFGFSETETASLVSTAGLVAIGVFFVAGAMLRGQGGGDHDDHRRRTASLRRARARDPRRGGLVPNRDRLAPGLGPVRVQLIRGPGDLPTRRTRSFSPRLLKRRDGCSAQSRSRVRWDRCWAVCWQTRSASTRSTGWRASPGRWQ